MSEPKFQARESPDAPVRKYDVAHGVNGNGGGEARTSIDPVCGITVPANSDKAVKFQGHTYFFCSDKCMARFNASPSQFLKSGTAPQAGTVYTCPMHPEIRQIGPGTCPKCGMTLEPLVASDVEDTSEIEDMSRRFWVSVVLTAPLLFVTMSEFVPGLNLHHWFGRDFFNWVQGALGTPVVLWAGWPFFTRAWASFRTWHLNMFSLIGLGTGAAKLQRLLDRALSGDDAVGSVRRSALHRRPLAEAVARLREFFLRLHRRTRRIAPFQRPCF